MDGLMAEYHFQWVRASCHFSYTLEGFSSVLGLAVICFLPPKMIGRYDGLLYSGKRAFFSSQVILAIMWLHYLWLYVVQIQPAQFCRRDWGNEWSPNHTSRSAAKILRLKLNTRQSQQ